jgi:2-(1,2-epoxy-1,2-dihydrophenyl)acetyl-CoA isomerase
VDDAVLLEIGDDGVAHLTLNRPDAANAFDVRLANDLADAAAGLAGDPSVRAVLLTGAGARFCAGGDVRAFASAGDDLHNAIAEVVAPLHRAVDDLAALDAPVIAAVQGSAAGAGLALVVGADYVLAAQSAKLVMAYTGIGLIPDGGSTWYLPRVIGLRRATELALTNRVLSADEACDWGLVNRVVADADLHSEAAAVAANLAAGPTRALGAAKRLLRQSLDHDLNEQLDAEAAAMVAAGRSVDGREGVAAFVEKRAAEFRGA